MQVTKWTGRPISRPGWYSGIPLEKYHSAGICTGPAVSSSDLRACWSRSAAHMFAEWSCNPKAAPRKTTTAMVRGACAHHLILGEDSFSTRWIAHPPTYRDRVTAVEKTWHNGANFCRAWVEKQEKIGRTVVSDAILQSIVSMSRSLALLPIVNDGLLRGHVECSGFWKDEATGLWCKVRPDVVPIGSGIFVDLKTIGTDCTSVAVQSAIRSRGYHQQGAMIWEATDALSPVEAFEFVLMFVEVASPHCARTVPLHPDDLARGRQQNRAMLRMIANCINADHWPGPGQDSDDALPLSVDERARIDARLKFEGLL